MRQLPAKKIPWDNQRNTYKENIGSLIQQSTNHARVHPNLQELIQLLKHYWGRGKVTSRREAGGGEEYSGGNGDGSGAGGGDDDGGGAGGEDRTGPKAGARGEGAPSSSSWLVPSLQYGGGLGAAMEMDDSCVCWMNEMMMAARVDGAYMKASRYLLRWCGHPRAQDEHYLLPIPSLWAKDPVGTIGDEIGEESRLERQLSKLFARQTTAEMTACGRMERRLLFWPPLVKRSPILHTNSGFDVLGLVGFLWLTPIHFWS
jgi:hypothetical protein